MTPREVEIDDQTKDVAIEHIDAVEDEKNATLAGRKLGTVVLEIDGQRVLVPAPSNSPNDPLNWSQSRKYYLAALGCVAALLSNAMGAGPSVAMGLLAPYFTHPVDIQKTAYFFVGPSLTIGVSNLLWMPLVVKYGRRINYLVATFFYMVTLLWCALSNTYASMLSARLLLGLFCGGAEAFAPLIIADLFFLHERGKMMAIYTVFLSLGANLGVVINGLVILGLSWQWMFWIALIFVSILFVLIFFTYEETAYIRATSSIVAGAGRGSEDQSGQPARRSYAERLKPTSGTYTSESLLKMFVRPLGLIFLPAVAFATMVFSVTIGALVAISSNFATALGSPPYHFTPTQSGLCFIAGAIGALIGIPLGGHLGDWAARRGTRRNGGVFEPEFRLAAMAPALVTGPLALILYGVGIQHGLHWIMPTIGVGLLSMAICHATNIAMTYAIDVYKPIAGEVIVAILAFKGVFGFALSFGTNEWIALQGYQNMFGQLAAIMAFGIVLFIPFQIWGARWRHASYEWRLTKAVMWDTDRDDKVYPAAH